jgi:murein L,D-transpeptidase YafK
MKLITLAFLLGLFASLFLGPEAFPGSKRVPEAPPPVKVPEAPPPVKAPEAPPPVKAPEAPPPVKVPEAPRIPASILYIGEQAPSHTFLVDKSTQRLHLYRQDADGPKLVKTFVCATGENSGGKKSRGDKRTPEGVYFFTRVIESKNLSSIYGIRAFPMDFPNFLDRMDYLRGDGIWLHGTDKPLTPYSTNGCIVLDNRDVAELSQYIRFRQTPIIIEEKVLYTTLKELNEERERFRGYLAEWKRSWETKQLDDYMSFYSKDFQSKGLDWKAWRDYKYRLNLQYKTIQITIDPPTILKHNRNVVAAFFQSYRSDRFFNEGTKRLYFTREENTWKIIGEDWHPQRGGEAPPPISETILMAFLSPKTSTPKPETSSSQPPKKAPPVPAKPDRDLSQKVQEIQAFLASWKESWEAKDLNRYMGCYAKSFRGQGKSREQWRQHKKNLNSLYRQIEVILEDVKILPKNGEALVSFRQVYRSDGLRSTGQKSLLLKQEGNSWKIIRETFSRSRE